MKTYYVTKYAIAGVILEVQGREEGQSLVYVNSGALNGISVVGPQHWHESLYAAQARAAEMARAKLKSLDRQRAKLNSIVENGASVEVIK
jgi:hypothetical protein